MANHLGSLPSQRWHRIAAKTMLVATITGALGTIANEVSADQEYCDVQYTACTQRCQADRMYCMSGFPGACDNVKADAVENCENDKNSCYDGCRANPTDPPELCEQPCSDVYEACKAAANREHERCTIDCDLVEQECDTGCFEEWSNCC